MSHYAPSGLTARARILALAGTMFATGLSSCSVGMAMSGHPDPNVGALDVGQNRAIVLVNLGQPAKTSATPDGRRDVFHLERGNQKSGGRAVGHAVMDVLTLGIWEIVGTPIEGFQGDDFTVVVDYDKVTEVQAFEGHTN